MNHPETRRWRVLCAVALTSVLAAACSTLPDLPAGLSSPDHGVVCASGRGACFDRFGPSIGLTDIFLGPRAARALTVALREAPPARGPDAEFFPGDGISCRRETGPCQIGGGVNEALTTVLYAPRPAGSRSAEAPVVVGVDWQWIVSRYNNDSTARPIEPARYRLRLEPDGSLRARVDCNQAGGRYRIAGGAIEIEVTHSTMAACEPGSLDQTFQRDISAAAIFFVRQGRLYLDLKHDTGTMEFRRE